MNECNVVWPTLTLFGFGSWSHVKKKNLHTGNNDNGTQWQSQSKPLTGIGQIGERGQFLFGRLKRLFGFVTNKLVLPKCNFGRTKDNVDVFAHDHKKQDWTWICRNLDFIIIGTFFVIIVFFLHTYKNVNKGHVIIASAARTDRPCRLETRIDKEPSAGSVCQENVTLRKPSDYESGF